MSDDVKQTLKDEASRLPSVTGPNRLTTIGFGLFLIAAFLGLVIFQWKQAAVLEMPVQNFADYLKTHHLTTTLPEPVTPKTNPPASKVYELTVAGKKIWLCYFDPADHSKQEALGSIKESGTLEIDGQPRPAKVREVVVLVGYDGSEKEAEILQAFADYESK